MSNPHELPTMTFADALTLLREGKPVRRASWPLGMRQRLVNPGGDNLYLQFHDNQHFYTFSLTGQDVLADDWLEYV